MSKIGIVILHYLVIEETKHFIESIKICIGSDNYEIIVVDNASPNGTGEELAKFYENELNIHVILNKTNCGFSKGNNIGFIYAKRELKCDFIIISNNDIIMKSNNFSHIIEEDYKKYHYAVLGPHIKLVNMKNATVNPYHSCERSREKERDFLEKKRKDIKIAYMLSNIMLDGVFLESKKRIGKLVHRKKDEDKQYKDEIVFNTGLHGCFWIFSPDYIKKFDGLMEITFMYHEEWILYDQMRLHNMLMMYDPRIKILHLEKASTKMSGMKKRYQRELESIDCVLKYLEKACE